MSAAFKIFLLFLLLFVAFWAHRVQRADMRQILQGVNEPAAYFETLERRPTVPESSPVDSLMVLWRQPPGRLESQPAFGGPELEPSLAPEFVPLDPVDVAGDLDLPGDGMVEPPADDVVLEEPVPQVPRLESGLERDRLPDAAVDGERFEVIEHVVQEGETLWKLARRYLGSGTRADEILAFNDLPDKDHVRQGRTLKIRVPSGRAPQGSRVETSGQQGRVQAGPRTDAVARRHRVRDGETLVVLARRYYNDGERWSEIYSANRDVVQNPDRIKVGVTLEIP